MLKSMIQVLVMLFVTVIYSAQAQSDSSTFIWPSLKDADIRVSVDKSTYFADDTIYLSIQLNDNIAAVKVTPLLNIEKTTFNTVDVNKYIVVIPPRVTPELYKIYIKVLYTLGQRFFYETNCFVNVEEHQAVEQVNNYVRISPQPGSKDPGTAVTLDHRQIKNIYPVI